MSGDVVWRGHLKRAQDGSIVGELRDTWNWCIAITATPNPEGGYLLEGRIGEIPAALRLPIDDEPQPVPIKKDR